MPYLDVYRLFFDPIATIEDESSVFGKQWRMTLEFILHQAGLRAAYSSRLGTESDLWIFLLWESESDREHFFHQTIGFGLMSRCMPETPLVYLFDDDSYDGLDKTKTWIIDFVGPVVCGVEDLEKADSNEDEGKREPQLPEPSSRYSFVVRQKRARVEKLYDGNGLQDAIIGLMESDLSEKPSLQCNFRWDRRSIELQKLKLSYRPRCTPIEIPANLADLVAKQPWEYGTLQYDRSEYGRSAHPLSLNFLPMMTIEVQEKPLRETEPEDEGGPGTDKAHIMCIVRLPESPTLTPKINNDALNELREKLGLQAGTRGLQEVSILQTATSAEQTLTTRLLCAWHSSDDFRHWQQRIATSHQGHLERSWRCNATDLSRLEWDNIPLTPDNQSWQKVDKILEIVEFTFAQDLSAAEMKAVEQSVYALTNTMVSSWSGDIDERPVVYAEDPAWTLSEGLPSSCLLLVAWDGTAQRAAWLRNFLSNDFTWTGHLAHTLASICTRVESTTHSMQKLQGIEVLYDPPVDIEAGSIGSDSDSDMGV